MSLLFLPTAVSEFKTSLQPRGQFQQKLGTNRLGDCVTAGRSKVFVFVGASVPTDALIEDPMPVTKNLLAVDDLVTIEIFDAEIDSINNPHNKDTKNKRNYERF